MKNPTSLTREQNLQNWSKIISECQAAKAKGTKVRDWLEAHNIPHDTYYYWYAEVRNTLVDEVSPGQDIIPISQSIIYGTDTSDVVEAAPNYPIPTSSSSCIRLTVNGITIEVDDLVNPNTIKGLIWEGDGFLMLTKRLERGRYSWPRTSEDVRALTPEQFKWLMHGFSIDSPIQVVNPDYCA